MRQKMLQLVMRGGGGGGPSFFILGLELKPKSRTELGFRDKWVIAAMSFG